MNKTETVPEAEIETIAVDPEEILEAFRRNRRDENEQRSHVLRVSPPFEGEKQAKPHVDEDHTRYPPEMAPTPIHLSPEAFVGDERGLPDTCRVPRYSEERRKFLKENDYVDEQTGEYLEWTDEMKAEFNEWWQTTEEIFEDHVRKALSDTITISRRTQSGRIETTIDVEYQDKP